MTEADRLFARFPDFIKEYIYRRGWSELREIQTVAAKVIFESEDNLLLSSSTASGKTEAAFFPILTELCEKPSVRDGVSVLYIAPLKSLINDQFGRIEELLEECDIPVFHWHGDVGASHKSRLLKQPRGILQITPESLESMIINRSNDIPRVFGDLRYVVIDEIHTMIGTDRGNQVLCQLFRLQRLLSYSPRRIGLSATLGDLSVAAEWLGAGSGRNTYFSPASRTDVHWRLAMEHFYIQDPNERQSLGANEIASGKDRGGKAVLDPGYEFLYDAVKDRKALVFSNSREETEYVTATLRQIAAARGDEDIFLIHHGNLSASLREDAEAKMKDDMTRNAVTCATVTMELGIDIGRLERVAQVGAPTTVSGFLQRLGRSGRRGNPPEMVLVFREDMPLPNTPLPQLIPWELLRGIAIVELYGRERFIEPPSIKRMPLSLAFHQTLSVLASCGERSPRDLAERILSMPPFSRLDKEDYRELLLSMINSDHIEFTERKGLIVGLQGERIINSYKFYAVFKDSEDYTVRCESEEIGTITSPPPAGDRFALAGRVWEVKEVDVPRKLVYVKGVEGKMKISWPGDSGEINTRIMVMIREILFSSDTYKYLCPNAAERLSAARNVAQATHMDRDMCISLGGSSYVLFPWLGTRSFRTLRRFMQVHSSELGISDIESEGCCYITFKAKGDSGKSLTAALRAIIEREGIDTMSLVRASESPAYDKYDDYIPAELLRKAFAADRLRTDEVTLRFTKEGGGL